LIIANRNQDFIPKLKKHLLPRIRSLLGIDNTSDATQGSGPSSGNSGPGTPVGSARWPGVLFKHDRMYKHQVMRKNFTSYDVHRDEDIVRAGTREQSNIMVLAPESANIRATGHESQHPFWYARVLGIYHVNVIYVGEGNTDYLPRRLEFLWVRWYELEDYDAGWSRRRLDHVSFPPLTDEHSFGFLNPDDVLRACHVIPLFQQGSACERGPGLSCCDQDHDHEDWKLYAINRCVLLALSSVF
jgi:hypothetical protein